MNSLKVQGLRKVTMVTVAMTFFSTVKNKLFVINKLFEIVLVYFCLLEGKLKYYSKLLAK